MGETPPAGIVIGLDRGGGRAQNGRTEAVLGAYHGQIPGVVAQVGLLFVGGVVFLIHHDETDILKGGEDRRTGPDDDGGLAVQDAHPLVQALAGGQAAVQHGDLFPETGPEAPFHLGDEGDFRHQHEGCFLAGNGLGHQVEVDFGLAAAGDALQQDGGKSLGPGLMHGLYRLALLPGQLRRGLVRQDRLPERVPVGGPFIHLHKSAGRHPAHDGGGPGQHLPELLQGRFPVAFEVVQNLPPLGCQALTGNRPPPQADHLFLFGPRVPPHQGLFAPPPAAALHGLQQAARHRTIEMGIEVLQAAGPFFQAFQHGLFHGGKIGRCGQPAGRLGDGVLIEFV